MASASSGAAKRVRTGGWYRRRDVSPMPVGVVGPALAIIDGSRLNGRGASLAQSVEHSHGKAGVVSSILTGGSPLAAYLRWSEHTAHNRVVDGSSPAAATRPG